MNNKKLSDGIYLVNAHGGKILYTGKNVIKDCKGVKYIGIKKDSKAICIALKDLRGRKPLTCRSDNTENYNNYISDKNLVASDWNGKKNTEHLKEIGLFAAIHLKKGEYIPSIGELKFIQFYSKEINEALEFAGGKQLSDCYLSSSEKSKRYSWILLMHSGLIDSYIGGKDIDKGFIRLVKEF